MNYISDIPMGLGMAFAKNLPAFQKFTDMSESDKQAIIDHTHIITSKKEMEAFVLDIAEGKFK